MKNILTLVPSSGKTLKEVRASLDFTNAVFTALLGSLAQLSRRLLRRCAVIFLLWQHQAISGDPANREQQEPSTKPSNSSKV